MPTVEQVGVEWKELKSQLLNVDKVERYVITPPHAMAVLSWSAAVSFQEWWLEIMANAFTTGVWPLEGDQSLIALNDSPTTVNTRVTDLMAKYLRQRSKSVDATHATIQMCFAILVGGTGSPPHIDVMSNVTTNNEQ